VIEAQDFVVSANPPTISIQTKHHASMTVTVSPIGQFAGKVTLSCVDTEPAWASCAFAPATVDLNGGAAVSSTLTIDTDEIKDYAAVPGETGTRGVAWLAMVLPLALVGFKKRRRAWLMVMVAVCSAAVISMSACSGNLPQNVEPGVYTMTVQGQGTAAGASVATTHTMAVTLTVTP